MKLIVGLGNPSKEYENTRHNVGFMAIDKFLGNVKYKEKYNGKYYVENDIIYLKPLSYMNDSGKVVSKFVNYYKIAVHDVLIIYDDMDFELGQFKIKPEGSSAGHNGIKSVIKEIGSEDVKRIRVGISKPEYDKIDYVLGKFSKDDKIVLEEVLSKISNVIKDYAIIDFDKLMNKYN